MSVATWISGLWIFALAGIALVYAYISFVVVAWAFAGLGGSSASALFAFALAIGAPVLVAVLATVSGLRLARALARGAARARRFSLIPVCLIGTAAAVAGGGVAAVLVVVAYSLAARYLS